MPESTECSPMQLDSSVRLLRKPDYETKIDAHLLDKAVVHSQEPFGCTLEMASLA
jgi:hypothetical protein